jgi:AhpD family alkylhydroperoxidase
MNTETDTATRKPRMEHWKAAPEVMKAMLAMESTVRNSGLDPILQDLIKLRVSQINGCAYCADLHFKDAKKIGETDQRLNLLAFWHEVDLFTPKEKAALHWTEKLTRLSSGQVSDEDFAIISAQFSEPEIVKITLAIVTINGWNRFGVGFRLPVGFKA